MSLRPTQLALRLDSDTPAKSRRWRDGNCVAFLGRTLTLRLDTCALQAIVVRRAAGDELHLPLPPQASARQIQDSAEAWLRAQAEQLFARILAEQCTAAGCPAPPLHLSFAAGGGWIEADPPTRKNKQTQGVPGRLRCNWRLIEQAPEIIEQVFAGAVAGLRACTATPDLFGPMAA